MAANRQLKKAAQARLGASFAPRSATNTDPASDLSMPPSLPRGLNQLLSQAQFPSLNSTLLQGQTVVAGYLMVAHDAGQLPGELLDTDLTYDFGQAMSVNDFILLKNDINEEIIQVGTLVADTTYNITRGGTAYTWGWQAPYTVLGYNGDGWMVFDATSTPKIRVYRQGTTATSQTTVAALGDLNGVAGVASEIYGLFAGDYPGGNYVIYRTDSGFKVVAGTGTITMDANGLAVDVTTSYDSTRSVRFTNSGTTLGAVRGYRSAGTAHVLQFAADSVTSEDSTLDLRAESPSTKLSSVLVSAVANLKSASLALSQPGGGPGVASLSAVKFRLNGGGYAFGGSPDYGIHWTGGAYTGLASTVEQETILLDFASSEWAAGTLAKQRFMRITQPEVKFASASTLTESATVSIDGPPTAGTNATLSKAYALWVEQGVSRFDSVMLGGTSFPASPYTDQIYYRTDRDMWYFYDGTRWLTTQEFCLHLTPPNAAASASGYASFTADSNTIYVPLRTDYDPYFTRVEAATRVNTTNNGTNFWTVNIQGVNLGVTAATTIATFNTSGDTAGTYTEHAAAASTNIPTNKRFVRGNVIKTLTPGTLDAFISVWFRLVG